MEKIILTDCDGCLCNWNDTFDTFMHGKGYTRVADTAHEYNISKRYSVTNSQAFNFVEEFNESISISQLEPFADSKEYVRRLADDGYRFIAITSLGDSADSVLYRQQNLISLFGNVFDDIICLPQGQYKRNILSRWKDSGLFWVEDHIPQALAGLDVGLRPIIVDHKYNDTYNNKGILRVSNKSPWQEIYAIVTN